MDGHHPNAFGAFLDDGSLARVATLRISLDLFNEGPERRGTPLEAPGHVYQPQAIGQRLLTCRPQRDTGVGAHLLEKHCDRLRDRTLVAAVMERSGMPSATASEVSS